MAAVSFAGGALSDAKVAGQLGCLISSISLFERRARTPPPSPIKVQHDSGNEHYHAKDQPLCVMS